MLIMFGEDINFKWQLNKVSDSVGDTPAVNYSGWEFIETSPSFGSPVEHPQLMNNSYQLRLLNLTA